MLSIPASSLAIVPVSKTSIPNVTVNSVTLIDL